MCTSFTKQLNFFINEALYNILLDETISLTKLLILYLEYLIGDLTAAGYESKRSKRLVCSLCISRRVNVILKLIMLTHSHNYPFKVIRELHKASK